MVLYEPNRNDERRPTAHFPGGLRVPVLVARDRSYPGLPSSAPETLGCYAVAADVLAGRSVRTADMGCGSGAGTARLAAAGLDVTGIDSASDALAYARASVPGVSFERGAIESGEPLSFDALVLVDVLGLGRNDAALLRGLAARVPLGTTLVGAVPLASTGQHLDAPARHAFTPEALDAVLVRAGWASPTGRGRVDGMLVFESHRTEDDASAHTLALADAREVVAAESLLSRLTSDAQRATDPAVVRELLLAATDLLCARGEYDAAEVAAASANAIAPQAARPLLALARTARARGAWDDAEALVDHALSFDEANADAWVEMAAWLDQRGDHGGAVESLTIAAALEPADHAIAAEEARVLCALGRHREASAVLDRVLAYGGGLSPALLSAMCSTTYRLGIRPSWIDRLAS